MNDLNNIIPGWVINVLADIQIFLQFSRITIIYKFYYFIVFGIFPGEIWVKNTIAQICIIKNAVIKIIGIIGCFLS